jgi:hypothetical protein
MLELLEHRMRAAAGKRVAGQQQHRQPVHRRHGGAGDHIRCARTDRRRARKRLQPVLHFCVGNRCVDHPLLVAGLVIGQVFTHFFQRLSQTGHVAVTEDAENCGNKPLRCIIPGDVLRGEKSHNCLGRGQANCPHGRLLSLTSRR